MGELTNYGGVEYNLADGLDWDRINEEYLEKVDPDTLELSRVRANDIVARYRKGMR